MLNLVFRKRVGVMLLFALLCATGVALVTQLSVQLYPRTNRPALMTTIRHDGYSALAFSRLYAEMIESRLMGVPGVDQIEARYGSNQSSFTITFNWNVDASTAQIEAEAALAAVGSELPSDFGGVSRTRFFTGENAGYLIVGLSSPTTTAEDLYRIATTSVEDRLNQVPDVDVVEILNVENLRVDMTLRQEQMLSYGITIANVDTALRQGTMSQSVGSLDTGISRVGVRIEEPERSLFEIGETVVRETGGAPIRLKDIADIDISYAIPNATFVMAGTRGIQLLATPIDGGNIRSMSQEITRILAQARDSGVLPVDTEINLLLDPAAYVNRAIGNVVQAALIGALLAMTIVFMTLGEVPNTLLIGVSLPVTLTISFILLYAFGVGLDLISLGGMALAVGMIVDSSIVVMENIHRFRVDQAHHGDIPHLKDLIVRAVRQVRAPVVASTLTSILVFLPISFTAPLTNAILGAQSKVVVFALGVSLVVSLTLIPLLAFLMYRTGRKRPQTTEDNGEARGTEPRPNLSDRVTGNLALAYARALRWILERRAASLAVILASAGVLAFALIVVLPRIPTEILSPPQSDRLIVFIQPAADTTSEEMVESKIPEMTAIIDANLGPYVANTYAEVRGRFNRLFVVLHSTRDIPHVTSELQRLFESDNDWSYNILNWDPAQLPLPRTNDLQISLSGPDETEVMALLERTRDLVSGTGLYAYVSTVPATNYTDELIMRPRRETQDGVPGYTLSSVASLLQRALVGTQTVSYEVDGVTVSARARYPDALIRGESKLENFALPYNQSTVPVKHLFDFSKATSISQIASENGQSIFRVYAGMNRGAPASDRPLFEKAVREEVERSLAVPEGYTLTFNNAREGLDSAIRSLFLSLGISVALIYLLLSFQFSSLSIPLVVLVSIPLGFIGLVVSLFLFGSTLSLNSLLGAILLSGIVVNNSIIMIDFYRASLGQHATAIDALVHTAQIRLRPILITTLTTIAGMLPIAMGIGQGSNVIRPLGIAVSGGLFVSMVLTLFVIPAILSLTRIKPAE
jgi:HAE1 family hydrophobic/amphiphilic exporter-1